MVPISSDLSTGAFRLGCLCCSGASQCGDSSPVIAGKPRSRKTKRRSRPRPKNGTRRRSSTREKIAGTDSVEDACPKLLILRTARGARSIVGQASGLSYADAFACPPIFHTASSFPLVSQQAHGNSLRICEKLSGRTLEPTFSNGIDQARCKTRVTTPHENSS